MLDDDPDFIISSPPHSPSLPASDALQPSVSSSPGITSRTSPGRVYIPGRKQVYVELRTLTEEERSGYEEGLSERPITFEEAFPEEEMEEIVGQREGREQLLYYVRLSDGTVFGLPSDRFDPDSSLISNYEIKRSLGTLPPFDPSASYVHPVSRVKHYIDLRTPEPDDSLLTPLTDETPSPEEESDGYEEDDVEIGLRRTTRSSGTSKTGSKKKTALPFSPRKTRSRKITDYLVFDDDEDDELLLQAEPSATRRSTRTKKSTRANLDDGDYDDNSDGYESAKQPTKKKKVKRGKASRPAYGHVRLVADLDYDSDEETAPLRAHRPDCAKCHERPTHLLIEQAHKKKGRKKKPRRDEDEPEEEDEEARFNRLGGWVQCLKCPIAAHWGCLAKTQKDEILRAANEKLKAEWVQSKPPDTDADALRKHQAREPIKRYELDAYETTEFICGACMKGGVCYTCLEVVMKPDSTILSHPEQPTESIVEDGENVEMASATAKDANLEDGKTSELLFRCSSCRRVAHYAHLPLPPGASEEDYTNVDLASYYQGHNEWKCNDCVSFVYQVEYILAWRPWPANAVEPTRRPGDVPNFKDALPREYLVKWAGRSYRRVQWVPHGWLVAESAAKLKNFLTNGPHVQLLPNPVAEENAESMLVDKPAPAFGEEPDDLSEGNEHREQDMPTEGSPSALPDAERRIQPAWKLVDRVLDVRLWRPEKRLESHRSKKSKSQKNSRKSKPSRSRIESDEEEEDLLEAIEQERQAVYDTGEPPSDDLTESVEEWEHRTEAKFGKKQIALVIYAFFKWGALGYDNSSWDSPPEEHSPAYAAFQTAFLRFLKARKVEIPILDKKQISAYDNLKPKGFKANSFTPKKQPQLGQADGLSLMPFQVDGVNWLCNNWWHRQHCILADEMGLGKTVQIVTFIGQIIKGLPGAYSACPALVVVPNSTITNWVREFERWAPNLRVVPFHGEAKAREVIKQYELYHGTKKKGYTGVKYHVLITTYETLTNARDVGLVFSGIPRWEVLVVDEGQRLKSDSSLLFKKLKLLNTVHRIILTGTPLNNNIRELFNLMNFLDPKDWDDLNALEHEYEVLTDEKIKELHLRLRPYFLRRIKSEVLQLPPKNEVIVPVSMSPLQKEIYKSILSQNLDLLQSIARSAAGTQVNAAIKKTNMNNMLMQLRKCLQHPYLVSRDIEPTGLSLKEAHEKLVSASAKLVLLQSLLPKLKARGHRVLLFSQFVIALDIVEDYLRGEGFKYLRLDGNTKQVERQKDMDLFNKENSDIFIYILSTRAGGVGINLWSADTVIIFDPDFNPHQDLQAIARAHRYGQQKTCLVFKLMVKESAEERIMQNGKKKLVLDHLIVQKMDDEANEDVQSILMFGAQALFQEGDHSERDIHYSDQDIDKLIEKTETEGEEQQPQQGENMAFSFAKIWATDKDDLEEMDDSTSEPKVQDDAWAQTLQRIAEERAREKEQEATGRGARRRAAPVFPQQNLDFDDSPKKDAPKPKPKKGKGKAKATGSEDEDMYTASDIESFASSASQAPSDPIEAEVSELADRDKSKKRKSKYFDVNGHRPSPEPIIVYADGLAHGDHAAPKEDLTCGLCGLVHVDRPCFMTESSENLAEYRNILMTHAGDEPIEERRAAIAVIDETLYKRGHINLVYGQPLHPVERIKPPQTPRVSNPPPLPRPATSSVIGQVNGHRVGSSSNGVPNGVPQVVDHKGTQLLALPRPKPRPIPRVVTTPNAVAGSSKRPSSTPTLAEPPLKKAREQESPLCDICGRSWHKVKRCPVVVNDPNRINVEIARLQHDPSKATTVKALTEYLANLRQQELLRLVTGTGNGA